jgi:hypothetical protein
MTSASGPKQPYRQVMTSESYSIGLVGIAYFLSIDVLDFL